MGSRPSVGLERARGVERRAGPKPDSYSSPSHIPPTWSTTTAPAPRPFSTIDPSSPPVVGSTGARPLAAEALAALAAAALTVAVVVGPPLSLNELSRMNEKL